ncbi:MAG: linear amide C-N hydrolase [Bacteroidia bacterium]|nr:linear amide C-N hydrolase [Bacteroidia bacterium]
MKHLTLFGLIMLSAISSCKNNGSSNCEGTPSPNPAALLLTDAQKETAATLRDIKDGHLYRMDYSADYKIKELLAQGGARSNEELVAKVFKNLLNLPVSAPDSLPGFGCSAFCVKSPEGDVLVGRNFDYRFVSSANIVVHNLVPQALESFCISAMPYLDVDKYVAGSLSDGTTDISVPTVASIYCCLDGMNEAGLFIGVLSLRGGGAVQHDPDRSNIIPSLAIRLCLDGCKTIDEALDVFRSHNFFADGEDSPNNYHFLIADASGRSVVVEYYRPGEEAPVGDAGAKDWTLNVLDEDHVTNFYLSEGWQSLGVGQARYDSLHTTLDRTKRIMTEDECMDLLNVVHTDLNSENGEITSNTQWSAVYNLTRKTATVCVDKDYGCKLHFSL